MRPRYVFEIKKPTKSASYQSPLKYEVGRKMGPKRNLKKKAASLHSETVLKNIIIINLKNLTTNKTFFYLFFINWLALSRLSYSPSRPYMLTLALIG